MVNKLTKYTSPLRDLNEGFAIDLSDAADARQPLRALFLCVDFPNRPAGVSAHPDPRYYYDLLAGDGLRIFREISYGRLKLDVLLLDRWFTMPKEDADYGMERVISWETHRNYIRDAMDAAADEVNFDEYDILYIAPVEGSAVPYSPTMTAKSWPVEARNGSTIGLVVTFGADMYYRRGKLFAHENGHILGLPDLYLYEVPEGVRDCFAHCGAFDLMGLIEGLAPDYLGYHKWRLGWIGDEQTAEVPRGSSGLFDLTPLETEGGLKLINLPIDGENGIVVEYRAPRGLDAALGRDGCVVYRINGRTDNGAGCATILPPEPEKYLALDPRQPDGLLLPGQTVERDGIAVTDLGGGRVAVKNNARIG